MTTGREPPPAGLTRPAEDLATGRSACHADSGTGGAGRAASCRTRGEIEGVCWQAWPPHVGPAIRGTRGGNALAQAEGKER